MDIGLALKVGQIYLEKAAGDGARQFQAVVEGLDRLAIEQHVLVASAELARSLSALPYVTVGPVVGTPVMAYCLIPDVDVAHVHDGKSGQTGLLLTLTRAVPYVITSSESIRNKKSLWGSLWDRASAKLDHGTATHGACLQSLCVNVQRTMNERHSVRTPIES